MINKFLLLIVFVLVIFLLLVTTGGRPLSKSTSVEDTTTVRDIGHDLQSAGRNVADSIRNAIQPSSTK